LVIMISQKDLGSSLLFFALFLVLVWVATERATYVVLGLGLFSAGAFVAWTQFSHVQDRVSTWLDPWADPKDDGFQILESIFALAEGGVAGTGPGLGEPDRIPEVETDFIFAAIGEEWGLLGSAAVLIAYLLMIGSGLRIAVRAERTFDKLLATGLTALIGVQAFIIIGGVIRLVPLTGVTLPFVSYGGSSLLSNYVLIALLMRISDEVERPPSERRAPGRRRRARRQTVIA
jgi:peptidoglycan glycosyltransferase